MHASADLLLKLTPSAVEQGEPAGSVWREGKVAIRADWYRSIVSALLSRGWITNHERNILRRFRRIHNISDQVHESALSECKWTDADLAAGVRHDPTRSSASEYTA